MQAVCIRVVELKETFDHVYGISDGLLAWKVLFEDREHFLLGESTIGVSVVVAEGVKQLLLELLLLCENVGSLLR